VQAVLSQNSDAAATVAFSNALLASDYGLDSTAAALVAADDVLRLRKVSPRSQSLQLTSRALVSVARGDFKEAEKQALQAVSFDHEQPAPVFALGRARYRQGNLEGARRAFQAALVRDPDFTEARVALAEVMLDCGQPTLAQETLTYATHRYQHHTRGQLVLWELQAAQAVDATTGWLKPCKSDSKSSPYIAAFCELVQAEQAWQSSDFQAVIAHARVIVNHRPIDPRVVGRAAQLLASLGFVDQSKRLTVEAARFASSRFPALRWAQTAIDLGRGKLVEMPPDLGLASSLVAPSLMVRIALASAGIDALSLAMVSLQKDHFSKGPILDSFSVFLRTRDDSIVTSKSNTRDPVEAYIRGLHARLAGDLPAAVRWLASALHNHGDACRAAGEYLAVCRGLQLMPVAEAFDFLKAENTNCVNLSAALAALNGPVPKSRKQERHEKKQLRDLE
jgi:tetratricopeptide (TPR) repeat protein